MSLTSDQRKMMVGALAAFYDLRAVACLTDAELRREYTQMCAVGDNPSLPPRVVGK